MSGLSHTPGKRAKGQTFRGFESRPLRQLKKAPNRVLFFGQHGGLALNLSCYICPHATRFPVC